MTSLVRIALSRPYTFVVMAAMILIGGLIAALRTPVDIFPNIGIPVIAVAFQYSGMSPEDMAGRIVTPFERGLTTLVNDIEHIEATSLPGIGIVKVFFQPGTDISLANAQVVAFAQTGLKQAPAGTTPPLVINFNASTVPILQLAVSGKGLNEQQLYDYSQASIRTGLISIPGFASPYPYGGRTRQIQIDLNPEAMHSKGLSAQDVTAAIAAQTQVTPSGFVKIGTLQYNVKLNNAPGAVEELNNMPIRTADGATVLLRDVAHARDGAAVQQNIAHVDGQRSVIMTVLKIGAASTIAVVDGVKAALPQAMSGLPKALTVTPLNDQSIFVKAAVSGVMYEGVLAAVLTSLMILLFLGSWRSTAIIIISIPLAVLASVAALAAFGQTLNVMTLGGLALAIGILVDDATVTIENINWHLEQGKDVRTAILDGAQQIVVPAFVSLLCICIVFLPMFYLPGVSGFLFVPMALAVVFAMVASFILSRTLVPTMALYLLKPHDPHGHAAAPSHGLARFQRGFEARFNSFKGVYAGLLAQALAGRTRFIAGFLAFVAASLILTPFLGRNFFPSVDSGSIVMHVRGPIGTRIEETSAMFDLVERRIREIIPSPELLSIVDTIGISPSGVNNSYAATGTIGSADGDIFIALKEGHRPTDSHIRRLREELPRDFPSATFSFLPADIVSQILNFGAPAPIDIQVTGNNGAANQEYAAKILRELKGVTGIADARIQQPTSYPELRFAVDRTRISELGLQEGDVTASVAGALAGTGQAAPSFWLNPVNGVSYLISSQTPEYLVDSLAKLEGLPVTSRSNGREPQVLGGLGTLTRAATTPVVSQYNIRPMVNVYASIQGRDLGAVSGDVIKVLKKLEASKPETVSVTLRGQYQTMTTAFSGMGWGLLGAVVLIYLLIVVNFQSWADPFVIVSALPAALAGIAWMLFATGTPLSVPALTGTIMCMGVATANSILVVSFAREKLAEHGEAARAAYEAGITRFRPVIMTALAMVIGMAPMAMSMGEGGEQNAPLGRAVIGGLIFATCTSLIFVPAVFAIVHGRRKPSTAPSGVPVHA
ncbi:MAG: efflux RND transporter permease subunit [Rhodospirillaceae bacterium]